MQMRSVVVVVLLVLVCGGGLLAWRSQNGASTDSVAPVPEKPKVTLHVAVPMGVYVPFGKVMDEFMAIHPEVEFSATVDTPETMAEGVMENERKPDIFISPGGHETTVLVEKGFVDPDSLVAFGSYEVAILVPKGNPGNVHEAADLLNPEVKIVSSSPTDLTAASHAAKQSLQNLGLWDQLESKVKITGCCNESFEWVVDGRAEANFQFLGCPIDPSTAATIDTAEIACILPRDTYYIPRNVAGIVVTTDKRELAEEFLAFLTSPPMVELMAKTKMRNDQDLPLTAGKWGPEYEASPMALEVTS
jgi:molybdate transport system substrate-binding protein